MLPYLQILVRVENDGSLHALGAFSTKDKLKAYQNASGLKDNQIRLDFYNGPFDNDTKVIYAGHRRWNMDRFQLGGYFRSENEAWNSVTQEGYVSVLRIDTTYEAEQSLEREALELYAQLQKRWRLSSYQELIAREGLEKARANITLRFYEDALESFRPKNNRDLRAMYALILVMIALPVAIFLYMQSAPDYGENVPSVKWLPDTASNISFYRSKQVQVYEFTMDIESFRKWAESMSLSIRRLSSQEIISRYKAYIPNEVPDTQASTSNDLEMEALREWQSSISAKIETGLIAKGQGDELALYDSKKKIVYFEYLIRF